MNDINPTKMVKELCEIRSLVASATYDIATSGVNDILTIRKMSDIADKLDILLSEVEKSIPVYPIDNVPLTEKERFWKGI